MARTIDWDQPLSDEDRKWAQERDWLHEKIADNDAAFGKGEHKKLSRPERIAEIRTEIDTLYNELERLEREEAEEANSNSAVVGDPATGNVIRDNTGVDGKKPDGAPDALPDYSDTSKWTNAKLRDEIEKRNVERKEAGLEELSTRGNRSELVERLQADDREIAAEQQQ